MPIGNEVQEIRFKKGVQTLVCAYAKLKLELQ